MLRDVRDYTSRIDFNNDVTYDHTITIVQPRDPAIAEMLTKFRGLMQANVLAGRYREHRRTAWTEYNHQRTTATDSSLQQVVEVGSKRDPREGWPPTKGGRHLSIRWRQQ